MGPRDRLSPPVVRESAPRLLDEPHGVLDSGEGFAIQQRAIERTTTGIPEDEQLAGQIPAVHGGYVAGFQRPKVGRVIPVVEVPPEPLEAAHRRKGCLQPFDGIEAADPAEIARGDRRSQVEPDVGRRRAVGEDRFRVLLQVVRR